MFRTNRARSSAACVCAEQEDVKRQAGQHLAQLLLFWLTVLDSSSVSSNNSRAASAAQRDGCWWVLGVCQLCGAMGAHLTWCSAKETPDCALQSATFGMLAAARRAAAAAVYPACGMLAAAAQRPYCLRGVGMATV